MLADANVLSQISRDFIEICRQNLSSLGQDDREQLGVAIDSLELSLNVKNLKPNKVNELLKLYENSIPDQKQDPEKAEKIKMEGNAFLSQNKNQEAFEKYSEAIKYNNKNPALFYNRGLVLFIMGKLDDALIDLKEAIALNPTYAKAHFKLSQIYEKQGFLDESIESCKRAVDLAPDIVQFSQNLSRIENNRSKISSNNAMGSSSSSGPQITPGMMDKMKGFLDNLKQQQGSSNPSATNNNNAAFNPSDFSNLNFAEISKYAQEFLKNPENMKLAADILGNSGALMNPNSDPNSDNANKQ